AGRRQEANGRLRGKPGREVTWPLTVGRRPSRETYGGGWWDATNPRQPCWAPLPFIPSRRRRKASAMSNRPRDIARVTKPIVRPLPEQARASGYVLIDDDLHCTVENFLKELADAPRSLGGAPRRAGN